MVPENAYIRLGAAVNNDGAQILRRPYSYNDGANVTAERWPPWRDEMEYDVTPCCFLSTTSATRETGSSSFSRRCRSST
jgi:hypothetical protein